MDFNQFVENVKIFWNQPLTIILFTIFIIIVGFLFVFGKTSLGKKALNKLKALYGDLKARYEVALDVIKDTRKEFEEFKAEKDQQIIDLTDAYEIKLNQYKELVIKQDEMIKVLCENSPNKKVKDAYEKYSPVVLDLPVSDIAERIREETRKDYSERLKALEEKIYGKREEKENTQTTGE